MDEVTIGQKSPTQHGFVLIYSHLNIITKQYYQRYEMRDTLGGRRQGDTVRGLLHTKEATCPESKVSKKTLQN